MRPPLSSPQAQELLLLPGDKINPSIFQQSSEYKEQTHSHPNINGFHIRDLEKRRGHTQHVRSSQVVTSESGTNKHSRNVDEVL